MPGRGVGRRVMLLLAMLSICHADFYKLLGVSKEATDRQLKKAYHKLALKHHPVCTSLLPRIPTFASPILASSTSAFSVPHTTGTPPFGQSEVGVRSGVVQRLGMLAVPTGSSTPGSIDPSGALHALFSPTLLSAKDTHHALSVFSVWGRDREECPACPNPTPEKLWCTGQVAGVQEGPGECRVQESQQEFHEAQHGI